MIKLIPERDPVTNKWKKTIDGYYRLQIEIVDGSFDIRLKSIRVNALFTRLVMPVSQNQKTKYTYPIVEISATTEQRMLKDLKDAFEIHNKTGKMPVVQSGSRNEQVDFSDLFMTMQYGTTEEFDEIFNSWDKDKQDRYMEYQNASDGLSSEGKLGEKE